MPFSYRVRDPLGNTHEGTLEAPSREEAEQQLRRDGFQVLDLEEDDDAPLLARRISKQEIIYATGQLAIMVDTGITLAAALAGMIEEEHNPSLRRVLEDLKSSVEAGEDFSAALARHPKHFDKTYASLIRASEATGSMGPMLERIATYLRKELETRSRIRAAMAYPAVMMVLAAGVTVFLLTYILPKFIPLFQARGTELPAPTRIMMGISGALMGHWMLWTLGAAALIAAMVIARRTEPGRRALDFIQIHLPITGAVTRKVTISRSVRTLGTMLESGVPMLDAIRLCGEVSGNYHYEKVWEQVRDQVTAGKRICEVLSGNPLFPRALVQMISSGEETGKLDKVLARVSTYYDHEVETSIKTATSLIEPIMISVMGVVVGGIGLALMLPIFSLSRHP